MLTERLILRQTTEESLILIFAQSISEQLIYFGFNSIEELDEHKVKLARCKANKLAECVQWDLIEKPTKNVIGRAGFHNWFKAHEKAELGYVLYDAYQRKGYMFEATQKMVAYAFEVMKLNRIEAFIAPDNLPSKNLIKKLGFTQEGLLRQHYKSEDKIYDSEVHSLLKEEFGY